MLAARDILLVLVVYGSVPFILLRPHIGILMWCWIAYMVPHSLTWGFARDARFAQIVGLATIVAWVFSREPKRLPMDSISILMVALLFWISLTSVFAFDPGSTHWDWDRAFKVLLMTFLTIIIMQSRKRIEMTVWVIIGSIGFYAVKGGFFMVIGGGGRVYGPDIGFFNENNAMGLVIVMVVPLMWYLQGRLTSPLQKWAVRGAMAVSMLAVIGTFSRGAALAAGAMALALIIKSRKRGLLVAGLVLGLMAAVPFIPSHWYDRIETIKTYEQDSSAMGRIDAWKFAFRLALDHPFMGGGFDVNSDRELFFKYVPEAETHRTFHSSYFQMLGEHGFAGLGIYLLLGFATYFTGSSIIRRTRGIDELQWANDLARCLQVSLVGYAVGGAFLDMAIFDLYYHIVALMLLIKLVVAKELATTWHEGSSLPVSTSRDPPSRVRLDDAKRTASP